VRLSFLILEAAMQNIEVEPSALQADKTSPGEYSIARDVSAADFDLMLTKTKA
jgi:hypothetical protein